MDWQRNNSLVHVMANYPVVAGHGVFSPDSLVLLFGWLVLSGLGGFPSALVVPGSVLG